MYFSDDISAISYMICCILLGTLPWENCKSSEEVLAMKKTDVLESQLKDYPLLLKFVTAFKLVNTDNIDYSYWMDTFQKAAKSCSPERRNLDFLPREVSQMKEKAKSMSRKAKSQSRKEQKQTTVALQETSESNSQEIQEILNQSPCKTFIETKAEFIVGEIKESKKSYSNSDSTFSSL